ncbi:hypothetical protein [Maribellus maritimus]|uniref:hypothetical protein n=1 Tax=Maribellus maritimus TaxID=2870838 RepID=UPI001EEC5864|nr:hypothetical protein [Maribellus maritimus]MCG6190851.1 hypothetical protein [Maribellus maritimus]
MKKMIQIIMPIACFMFSFPESANSQIIDVKKWTGMYPDMEESYPLTFISFKGLIPVPHVFVRSWPTHYYVEAVAMPVSDAAGIRSATVTGFVRIAARMLEHHHMKGRHDETVQIKDNTDLQKLVGEKIFNAKAEGLEDLYKLADQFIGVYSKIDRTGHLPYSAKVKEIFEQEADRLLLRFLMVNLLQTGHGEKLEAFSDIRATLNKLSGEVDYTYTKIRYFSNYTEEITSYLFLTQ